MRFLICLFTITLLIAPSALAEQKLVKDKDGSISIIEAGPGADKPPPVEKKAAPVQEKPAAPAKAKAGTPPSPASAEKPAAPPKPRKKSAPKKSAKAAPEPPSPSPEPSPEDIARQYWPPETPVLAPGAEITPEIAIAIALKGAPPALGVQALPRTHHGRPVYMVVFRTEQGPHRVLIDRATGGVLSAH